MTDSVDRLYDAVLLAKDSDPAASRTARLFRAGRSKIAKKLAEEAIEVVIDAMNGDRNAVVRESADLLYNLVVVWAASGVRPQRSLEGNGAARTAVRHRRKAPEGEYARQGASEGRSAVGAAAAAAAMTPVV
jgi:phosphoribosyl-ATP pyrophosphohydrolase